MVIQIIIPKSRWETRTVNEPKYFNTHSFFANFPLTGKRKILIKKRWAQPRPNFCKLIQEVSYFSSLHAITVLQSYCKGFWVYRNRNIGHINNEIIRINRDIRFATVTVTVMVMEIVFLHYSSHNPLSSFTKRVNMVFWANTIIGPQNNNNNFNLHIHLY